MNNLNNYILEKLKIDKNINIKDIGKENKLCIDYLVDQIDELINLKILGFMD